MPNAIEMFRAQRDAANQVHARLTDVASLLKDLHAQVVAFAANRDLRDIVHEQQTLIARTERLLSQIHYVREQEVRRYWPAVWRRWILAVVFALASAGAAGAGYAWATGTNRASQAPDSPADLADFVARRLATMTPVERRQFDGLLKKLPR